MGGREERRFERERRKRGKEEKREGTEAKKGEKMGSRERREEPKSLIFKAMRGFCVSLDKYMHIYIMYLCLWLGVTSVVL